MNEPKLYHTLRNRFETSKDLVKKGSTAQASDLNQLTITEALIEILATLDEISDTLLILTGVQRTTPATQPKSTPKATK